MSGDNIQHNIQKARELIAGAANICVLTGAGISQESGIPTFRGEDGLWRQYRAEELATPEAFYKDPKLVWEWYDSRREIISKAKPNPAHYALAELEEKTPAFSLITQNIDGLHRLAGSKNIVEIHGNIWQTRCTLTGVVEENHDVPLKELPPKCAETGELARPNVVWFGEMIPAAVIDQCLNFIESCELMLIIGTSALVQPAASMGVAAKQRGKPVIELNLDPTPNTGFYDITLQGKAGEILPQIV